MDHERKTVQAIFKWFDTRELSFHRLYYLFSAQGKQMMFTVKNFYDKVEASYEFTYTEN